MQLLVHLSRMDLDIVYVAQLPNPRYQIRLYTQCLIVQVEHQEAGTFGDAQRRYLLLLVHQIGIDVNAIVKEVVISLCDQGDEKPPIADASLQVI